MPKPDWLKIKNEYISSGISYRKLAEKYGINNSTLEKRAKRENWAALRDENCGEIAVKLRQKTAEKITDNAAELAARHYRISNMLLDVIEDTASNKEEFYKYTEVLRTGRGAGIFKDEIVEVHLTGVNDKKLLNIVSAYDKIQKSQRLTAGMLTPVETHKIECENAKLELEKQRLNGGENGLVNELEQWLDGKE